MSPAGIVPDAARSAAALVARAASPALAAAFLRLARRGRASRPLGDERSSAFAEAFGFTLFDDAGPERAGAGAGRLVRSGEGAGDTAAYRLAHPAPTRAATPIGDVPRPDAASARWIAMVAAAAVRGGCHFALRVRPGYAGADDVGDFCALVAERGTVATRIVRVNRRATLLGHVLREEVHAGLAPPLVVLDADLVAKAADAAEADYDDVSGFMDGAASTTKAEAVAAAPHLAGLRCTYVWRLPPGVEPPPDWRPLLAACVGPLSYDLEWSRRTVSDAAPALGARAVDAALVRVRDPREVRASARFAAVVAASGSGIGVDEAFELAVRSFPTVVGGTVPRIRTPAFEPGLFLCDHDGDLDPLVHAERLARGGCRILLAGPAGGGKSAWAMEYARRAGRPVEVLDGARFLAHRLGSLERNLSRLFQAAARSGAILWADEIDSVCGVRSGDGGGNAILVRTLTNEMIKHLDATAGELAMVAATNDAGAIDPSVRRRFDLVVTVAADLPAEREALAWTSILGIAKPEGMAPLGATCVADYALAANRCALLERRDPAFAADAVRRARDARLGRAAPRRYGFFGPAPGGAS